MRGVAKTYEFSSLVTLGADAITAKDKEKLCQDLIHAGVPICYEESEDFDEQLEEIAHTIAARAVTVS